MQGGKKMERNKFILVLALAVVFSILITKIIFYGVYVTDIKEVDIYVDVVESNRSIGMNVETDALRFPGMSRGNQGRKWINISSEVPARAVFKSIGEIKEWVHGNASVILKANETKTVEIAVLVPKDAEVGHHEAKLRVLFIRI